jgi:hypothetical protein
MQTRPEPELDNAFDEFARGAPADIHSAIAALREMYRHIPYFVAFQPEKKRAMADRVWRLLLDRYFELCVPVSNDSITYSAATAGLMLCAALENIIGGILPVVPDKRIVQWGLVHCEAPALSVGQLRDAVWLLGYRWHSLGLRTRDDMALLRDYIMTLVRWSCRLIGRELAASEVGDTACADHIRESNLPGRKIVSDKGVMYICEGLFRPLLTLEGVMLRMQCDPAASEARRACLNRVMRPYVNDAMQIGDIRKEVRVFIQSATLVGVDFALFADRVRKVRGEPVVFKPSKMMIMSRTSSFLSARMEFTDQIALSQLLSDSSVSGVTYVERIARIAIVIRAFHAIFAGLGVNVMEQYLVLEPYLLGHFTERNTAPEPIFLFFMGQLHVMLGETIFICDDALDALCRWQSMADVATSQGLSFECIDLSSIMKLFSEETGRGTDQKKWATDITLDE